MGDIENRLGNSITMSNAAMDERRSKWKFADFCVCWCLFIFILVLFGAAIVSVIKNPMKGVKMYPKPLYPYPMDPHSEEHDPREDSLSRRLGFNTESVVTCIIIVVGFGLVFGFISYSDRKKRLKAALLQEGVARTSSGSHPPFIQ